MKYLKLTFFVVLISGSLFSCKKRGCTIEYAKNYDATAKKNNKKCEFFYTAQITSIKVLDFPDLDPNGETWDDGTLPDLYIRFTNHEDDIKYQTPAINNIGPDDIVTWSIPSFVRADTANANSQFKVYEVDDLTTELIEKFPINFLDYMHESNSGLEKYPDSIEFIGNAVNMKIYLDWVE